MPSVDRIGFRSAETLGIIKHLRKEGKNENRIFRCVRLESHMKSESFSKHVEHLSPCGQARKGEQEWSYG